MPDTDSAAAHGSKKKGNVPSAPAASDGSPERYRRLPRGAHGLGPELVAADQRERLQSALIELIDEKGYQAVRIVDLARLARVSQPTFYNLYQNKEDLFIATYDRLLALAAKTVIAAYDRRLPAVGCEGP